MNGEALDVPLSDLLAVPAVRLCTRDLDLVLHHQCCAAPS